MSECEGSVSEFQILTLTCPSTTEPTTNYEHYDGGDDDDDSSVCSDYISTRLLVNDVLLMTMTEGYDVTSTTHETKEENTWKPQISNATIKSEMIDENNNGLQSNSNMDLVVQNEMVDLQIMTELCKTKR